MRALVLGGYGAVGAETVAELRSAGDTAFAAGRDPSRADRVVDLTNRSSYQSALGDINVVINAAGHEDPQLADLAPRPVRRLSRSVTPPATSQRWSFSSRLRRSWSTWVWLPA